jgi:hypothetical protein
MASGRAARSRAVTTVMDDPGVTAERSIVAEASPAPVNYYPIECPHCEQVAGTLIAVSSTAMKSSFVVELRCGECHHRWFEAVART